MDLIRRQIEQMRKLLPRATLLRKPINSVGDYLFFSHLSFEATAPRVHFSVYLARKELRSDLGDVLEVLETLMERRSELFEIERMEPVPLEGLFVVYRIDVSVSIHYCEEEDCL